MSSALSDVTLIYTIYVFIAVPVHHGGTLGGTTRKSRGSSPHASCIMDGLAHADVETQETPSESCIMSRAAQCHDRALDAGYVGLTWVPIGVCFRPNVDL